MKNTYTNKLTLTAVLASFAFLPLPASAGQDESQRYITQQAHKLQQQAKTIEAAKKEAAAIKQAECMRQMEQGNHASGS